MMFTLTRAQVREFDRRAIATYGVPGVVLMENAGRGCAEWLMRLNPQRQPVVILCGPGNNGGDGFVIARHLDNAGWPVRVHLFAPPYRDPTSEAAINYHILRSSQMGLNHYLPETLDVTQLSPLRTEFAAAGWIVDALFGTGLSKPLGPPFDRLVQMVQDSGKPVFAVDIPSGLDCDTGEPLGACIRAKHTATFVAVKRGFLNPRSGAWTGEVQVIDIGAPRVLLQEYHRRQETGLSD
jgi:NAD(P)H-hydrate epimerase